MTVSASQGGHIKWSWRVCFIDINCHHHSLSRAITGQVCARRLSRAVNASSEETENLFSWYSVLQESNNQGSSIIQLHVPLGDRVGPTRMYLWLMWDLCETHSPVRWWILGRQNNLMGRKCWSLFSKTPGLKYELCQPWQLHTCPEHPFPNPWGGENNLTCLTALCWKVKWEIAHGLIWNKYSVNGSEYGLPAKTTVTVLFEDPALSGMIGLAWGAGVLADSTRGIRERLCS